MKTACLVGVTIAILAAGAVAYAAQGGAREGRKTMIERKNYAAVGASVGTFSHAVRRGDMLYLSGMTAYGSDAQGKEIPEQARVVFDRIRAVAEAEGADLSALVKVTIFVTDIKQAPLLREELLRQYGDQPPASSMVEVRGLFSPGINIEIEAILGL